MNEINGSSIVLYIAWVLSLSFENCWGCTLTKIENSTSSFSITISKKIFFLKVIVIPYELLVELNYVQLIASSDLSLRGK